TASMGCSTCFRKPSREWTVTLGAVMVTLWPRMLLRAVEAEPMLTVLTSARASAWAEPSPSPDAPTSGPSGAPASPGASDPGPMPGPEWVPKRRSISLWERRGWSSGILARPLACRSRNQDGGVIAHPARCPPELDLAPDHHLDCSFRALMSRQHFSHRETD